VGEVLREDLTGAQITWDNREALTICCIGFLVVVVVVIVVVVVVVVVMVVVVGGVGGWKEEGCDVMSPLEMKHLATTTTTTTTTTHLCHSLNG